MNPCETSCWFYFVQPLYTRKVKTEKEKIKERKQGKTT